MEFTYKHTKFACNTCSVISAVINNFEPLLFVIFQDSFKLSITQLSSLITVNFATQIFVDLLGAKYSDILGYRKLVVLSQFFSCIGLLAIGFLPLILPSPYIGLLISVMLYAIGSALIEVITSPIMEGLPNDSKSGSMSLMHSFYCWGCVFVTLVTTFLIAVLGKENWRYIAFLWALLPLFNGILFLKVPIIELKTEKTGGILKLFSSKLLWTFMLIMLCSGAAEITMGQWSSYFAETALGVSKTVGDVLGPCSFAIFMGISRTLYGIFSEKIDLKKFMMGSSVLCIVSYLITALAQNPFISMIGASLCGFSVGIMWPGTLSLAAKRVPMGGAAMFAVLALFGDVGCSVGPEMAARISKVFSIHGSGLKAGFLCAVVFPLIMIVAIKFVSSLKEKNTH